MGELAQRLRDGLADRYTLERKLGREPPGRVEDAA
jgi:hypothetical protein